jgi:hypothetical protein
MGLDVTLMTDGTTDGYKVGLMPRNNNVGDGVGKLIRGDDGEADGTIVGLDNDGTMDGTEVGVVLGKDDGSDVGNKLGMLLGSLDGAELGVEVGAVDG